MTGGATRRHRDSLHRVRRNSLDAFILQSSDKQVRTFHTPAPLRNRRTHCQRAQSSYLDLAPQLPCFSHSEMPSFAGTVEQPPLWLHSVIGKGALTMVDSTKSSSQPAAWRSSYPFIIRRMDSQTGSGPQDEGSNGSEGISGIWMMAHPGHNHPISLQVSQSLPSTLQAVLRQSLRLTRTNEPTSKRSAAGHL